METGTIHYGFGAEYLPNWGIKQALRELYQNFLDYGDYEEETVYENDGKLVNVKLINTWQPDDLQYLRIGRSEKGDNENAIGHHGEGLKMAFLILLRLGFDSNIVTNKYEVWPTWYQDKEIGDCFSFNYQIHEFHEIPYTVSFQCNTEDFKDFKENLIQPSDILFTHAIYGDIVNKTAGRIYSGGLFVAEVKLTRAYNILPKHLPLDRDRSMPAAWDVNWATSKILEASQKMELKDLAYSDTTFIDTIPQHLKKEIKPVRVGDNVEFTYKVDGETKIIANANLKEHLKKDSMFEKAINGIKRFLAKQLGVYDLLVEFQKKYKYHLPADGKKDLEIILEKVNNK